MKNDLMDGGVFSEEIMRTAGLGSVDSTRVAHVTLILGDYADIAGAFPSDNTRAEARAAKARRRSQLRLRHDLLLMLVEVQRRA